MPFDAMPGSLPTERDFDPHDGDLDAEYAWKMFGGMSVDEALAKFEEHPLNRSEDFLFMGPVAFAFYFPVLHRFVRDAFDLETHGERIVSHLAFVIRHQFQGDSPELRTLRPDVLALAEHVLENVERFADSPKEWHRTRINWQRMVRRLPTPAE
jgi:hypothetical protein